MRYKEKCNIVLISSAIVLLLVFSYIFPPIESIFTVLSQREVISNAGSDLVSVKSISQQLKEIELELQLAMEADTRKQIIEKIEAKTTKHDCRLVQVLPISNYDEGKYRVTRNEFVLQGDFVSLLRVLKETNSKLNKYSVINSIKFSSRKNNSKNNSGLFLTLVIYSLSVKK